MYPSYDLQEKRGSKCQHKFECKLKHLLDSSKECDISLFVLRFHGQVNPMGSCRARSVYLTTRLLGRLSPLSS